MPETEKDDLQVYEIGFHILPTVTEAELREEVSKIHESITSSGGAIISESFPELINLAYEISKRSESKYTRFNKAYFGWVKFELERENIKIVDESLKSNPQILRHIIIKTVKENTLYIPKIASARKSVDTDGEIPLVSDLSEKEAALPVSEEEMDKSIDDLVIS